MPTINAYKFINSYWTNALNSSSPIGKIIAFIHSGSMKFKEDLNFGSNSFIDKLIKISSPGPSSTKSIKFYPAPDT